MPADTRVSRAFCSSSPVWPKAASASVIALRLAATERCSLAMRSPLMYARSARAAPVGSSLGLLMRLPLVIAVCASTMSRWRRCRLSTAAS